MEGNKVTTYAVVALIVGILVGVGVGYAAFHGSNNNNDSNTDETYWFYLYFGDNAVNTKWYSATGTDATDAFDKAMKNADLDYEVSKWGYISSIDDKGADNGGWAIAQYVYADTSSDAAKASVEGLLTDAYGGYAGSNGWHLIAGYGSSTDLKLSQFGSTVYFMSMYNADWTFATPDSTTLWMTDSTGPFATA